MCGNRSDTETLVKESEYLLGGASTPETSLSPIPGEGSPSFLNDFETYSSPNLEEGTRNINWLRCRDHSKVASFRNNGSQEVFCDMCITGARSERQEFAFTLYDFEGHGRITKDEISGLVQTIYDTVGTSFSLPTSGSRTIKVKLTVSPPIVSPIENSTQPKDTDKTSISPDESPRIIEQSSPRVDDEGIEVSPRTPRKDERIFEESTKEDSKFEESMLRIDSKCRRRKRTSFHRQELLKILQANMEKNNLFYPPVHYKYRNHYCRRKKTSCIGCCCNSPPDPAMLRAKLLECSCKNRNDELDLNKSRNDYCDLNKSRNDYCDLNKSRNDYCDLNKSRNDYYDINKLRNDYLNKSRNDFFDYSKSRNDNCNKSRIDDLNNSYNSYSYMKPIYRNKVNYSSSMRHSRSRSHDNTGDSPHTFRHPLLESTASPHRPLPPSNTPDRPTSPSNRESSVTHHHVHSHSYQKHSRSRSCDAREDGNQPIFIPKKKLNMNNPEHKHKYRVDQHTRAMSQVVQWLERSSFKDTTQSPSTTLVQSNDVNDNDKPTEVTDNCIVKDIGDAVSPINNNNCGHSHHVHKHFHHHYHHYNESPPLIL